MDIEKDDVDTSTDTDVDETNVSDEDSSTSEDSNEDQSDTDQSEEDKPSQKGDNTSDEKDVPFHEHPRFKEIIKARQEAEAKAQAAENANLALTKRLDGIEQSLPKGEEIPSWFTDGFGDNPELWSKFNSYNQETRGQLKAEIIEEMKGEEQAKVQKEEEGKQFVREEIQRLKDDGNDFDENKLKKVMVDYQVLDFDKGLELYKVLEKEGDNSAARKKIASSTQPSGKSEGESKVKTLGDMFGTR